MLAPPKVALCRCLPTSPRRRCRRWCFSSAACTFRGRGGVSRKFVGADRWDGCTHVQPDRLTACCSTKPRCVPLHSLGLSQRSAHTYAQEQMCSSLLAYVVAPRGVEIDHEGLGALSGRRTVPPCRVRAPASIAAQPASADLQHLVRCTILVTLVRSVFLSVLLLTAGTPHGISPAGPAETTADLRHRWARALMSTSLRARGSSFRLVASRRGRKRLSSSFLYARR